MMLFRQTGFLHWAVLLSLLLSVGCTETGLSAEKESETAAALQESTVYITTDKSAIPEDTSGEVAKAQIQTVRGEKTFYGFSQHAYDGENRWLANSGCGVGAFLSAVGPFIPEFESMDMMTFYEQILETGTLGPISKSGSIGYGGMQQLIEMYSDDISVECVQNYDFEEAAEDIREHLLQGQPVIITVMPHDRGGSGKKDKKYTNTGRFLALLGMTPEGDVIAADCGSDKPWSAGGPGQLRIKYGDLQDIVNHSRPVEDPDPPGNWYTWRGSNGYMKIYVGGDRGDRGRFSVSFYVEGPGENRPPVPPGMV